jgi:hypothetical protein
MRLDGFDLALGALLRTLTTVAATTATAPAASSAFAGLRSLKRGNRFVRQHRFEARLLFRLGLGGFRPARRTLCRGYLRRFVAATLAATASVGTSILARRPSLSPALAAFGTRLAPSLRARFGAALAARALVAA